MIGLFEVTLILLAILIPLGFAWVCARLAKSRGRDPLLWGLLGFLFNVWTLAALLIFSRPTESIDEKQTTGSSD